MDFGFLPEQIKEQLAELESGNTALCAIRSSGGLSGKPGESYLVSFVEHLYLFDRAFNERVFTMRQLPYSEISAISLNRGQFSSELQISTSTDSITAKLSSVEAENGASLANRVEKSAKINSSVNTDNQPTTCEDVIPPLIGLAATVMFVATSDGTVSAAENDFIRKVICSDNTAVFNHAVTLYEQHELETLVSKLQLDRQRKLCFLANMLEIGMIDGVLHGVEQKVIDEFVRLTDIDSDDFETVRNVLLIKNQLSILY